MFYYERTNLNEQFDITKSINSKNVEFVQNSACNGCHGLTMFCLNVSDIVIIALKWVDCRCIIDDVIKSEAIRLLENFVFGDSGYI